MGLFPWWRPFAERERDGEMRYWFESLWRGDNRSLTEATLKHKHLPWSLSVPRRDREERREKQLLLSSTPSSSTCSWLLKACRERDDVRGEEKRGRSELGSPWSSQIDELNRPGPWTPRNPPNVQWRFANRPFTQGQEPRQPGGWRVKFDLKRLKLRWTFYFQIWNPPRPPYYHLPWSTKKSSLGSIRCSMRGIKKLSRLIDCWLLGVWCDIIAKKTLFCCQWYHQGEMARTPP